MANNGYSVSGGCVPFDGAIIQICRDQHPSADIGAVNKFSDGSIFFTCRESDIWYGGSSLVPNCEIPGPPLTEQQQIEAINGLFPYAVAMIAVAWGFKFIRGLIENWLRDRNSDD